MRKGSRWIKCPNCGKRIIAFPGGEDINFICSFCGATKRVITPSVVLTALAAKYVIQEGFAHAGIF